MKPEPFKPSWYTKGYTNCRVCWVVYREEDLKDGACVDQERCLQLAKTVTVVPPRKVQK